MTSTAALFDLDRTLLDVNSALLWAQEELRRGEISRWQYLRAGLWTLFYHLSLIDMDSAFSEAVRHYRGDRDASLDARTRAWFDERVRGRLRPGGARALARHRELGDILVLVTNSSSYEARAATEAFGLDHWLANRFLLDRSDRLTGDFERPMCYGAGKVERIERWAELHQVDLAASSFYTDSLSDLPLLERVGRPFAVHPDPRLRWIARRRGWPILDWSS